MLLLKSNVLKVLKKDILIRKTWQHFFRHKGFFLGLLLVGKEIHKPKLALNKYLKNIP